MIPLRIYAYLAIALALSGLLWHDKYQTDKANRLARETNELRASYTALQAAQAHERKIATDATNDYERRLQGLSDDKRNTPTRSVHCRTAPRVPATGTASSGVDAAGAAGLADTSRLHPGYGSGLQADGSTGTVDRFSDAGPDLGPLLYGLMDEVNEHAARCNALMGFDGAR